MISKVCLMTLALGASAGTLAHRTGGLAVADQHARRSLGAAQVRTAQAAAAAQRAEAEASPIKRVLELLRKMKTELQAEADKEAETYDKTVCWCKTNEKEKTAAVAEAEAKAAELRAETEGRSARHGTLAGEIGELKQQIAEDTEALKKATAIREKAAAEYKEEEKDMVQTVESLRAALVVLGKVHGGSLLQVDKPLVSGLRVVLRDAAMQYEVMMAGAQRHGSAPRGATGLLQMVEGPSGKDAQGVEARLLSALDVRGPSITSTLPLEFAQRLVLQSARDAGAASFVQSGEGAPVDADYKSYSAQSTPIFSMMTTMMKDFQDQLSTMRKDEQTAADDYTALANTKKEQISIAKEKLDDAEGDQSSNQKALADANEDLELTRKQRQADLEFLRNLKVTCMNLDKEWELRSATRGAEIKAVTEAEGVLMEDDNRVHMVKTYSLLQERRSSIQEASSVVAMRNRAAEVLRAAARQPALEADDLLDAWHGRNGGKAVGAVGGPRAQLAALAMSVQIDSFKKVKAMMDTMIAEIKKQQKEESDFKDYCKTELIETEKATIRKGGEKKELELKLEAIGTSLDKLAKDVAAAKSQIADTQLAIKKASQDREEENAEFQKVVTDQRLAQSILQKALQKLKDFYDKGLGKKVNVVQLQTSARQAPAGFAKYQVNQGSKSVMGLMDMIINDSKELVAESTASEYKAQKDYETFVKDSHALLDELSATVKAKTKDISDAKLEQAETGGDLKSTLGELDSLAEYDADLHGQCDWVLANYAARRKARLQEIESIQTAKGILSGAGQ